MNHLSYIEINKKNLLHNLKSLKKRQHSKVAAVVKGNAYGHGAVEVVNCLKDSVDYFQVNSYEEFQQIRPLTQKPILLLGYVLLENLEEVVLNKGIPGLYTEQNLKKLNEIGKKHNTKLQFHLKIDCFLGRQGILPNQLIAMLNLIKMLEFVELTGVYSHFSNIEDTTDLTHAHKQIDCFKKAVQTLTEYGFRNFETHINATSGFLVSNLLNLATTITRLGIGLYGMWPSQKLKNTCETSTFQLKPVIRWVTHIAQIKTLPPNFPIGYGLTFVTTKPTKIAVIPQGYSDGYDRKLSNIGEVLVKGSKCRVLGRVAMNMFVVDISHLKKVDIEEEVILLGPQKSKSITAEEIAQKLSTINYEITTKISSLLPRVIN